MGVALLLTGAVCGFLTALLPCWPWMRSPAPPGAETPEQTLQPHPAYRVGQGRPVDMPSTGSSGGAGQARAE